MDKEIVFFGSGIMVQFAGQQTGPVVVGFPEFGRNILIFKAYFEGLGGLFVQFVLFVVAAEGLFFGFSQGAVFKKQVENLIGKFGFAVSRHEVFIIVGLHVSGFGLGIGEFKIHYDCTGGIRYFKSKLLEMFGRFDVVLIVVGPVEVGFFTVTGHHIFFVFTKPPFAHKVAFVVIAGKKRGEVIINLDFGIRLGLRRANEVFEVAVFADVSGILLLEKQDNSLISSGFCDEPARNRLCLFELGKFFPGIGGLCIRGRLESLVYPINQ